MEMELGCQIRKYRMEMNLSQEELAEKVYVSRQTVSNWENDKNYPDIKSLVMLSEIFHVSLDILVKGDIKKMKEVINESERKKYNQYGYVFAILFAVCMFSFVPLVKFMKIAGIIIWAILYVVTLVIAFKTNKIAKNNGAHTYKEIVAFMEGKSLAEIEKQREIGKRPYQNVLKLVFGATVAIVVLFVMDIGISAYEKKHANIIIENKTNTLAEMSNEKNSDLTDEKKWATFTLPTIEEVEQSRNLALEGMTKEEIDCLKENIKVANLAMERAYLHDNIFERLTDKDDLYWNYVDQEGDIQIGWAYDGTYKDIRKIREEEDLTLDEFYELYGTPVTTYNRFDAENFIELMKDMQTSIQNEELIGCFDLLIQYMEEAAKTHEVEPMVNIYKLLHDMDYYLLRHGPTDVSPYVEDGSLIGTYYGTLPFYNNEIAENEPTYTDIQDKTENNTDDMPVIDENAKDTNNSEVITRYIDFANYEVQFAESETEATPLTLSLVSETDNGISLVQDWLEDNSLFLPVLSNRGTSYMQWNEQFPKVSLELNAGKTIFYDDQYLYEWTNTTLNIYRLNDEQLLYTIEYVTSDIIFPANCAILRDGILYIGRVYNGYADGFPENCFLIAYDIEKDEVLWRSENQTFNSGNFILKDDVIICGYGFTGEDDYIYQIDANTGKVIDKMKLKKMPDMFVEKDGQIYVHTYSYDYVFDMN